MCFLSQLLPPDTPAVLWTVMDNVAIHECMWRGKKINGTLPTSVWPGFPLWCLIHFWCLVEMVYLLSLMMSQTSFHTLLQTTNLPSDRKMAPNGSLAFIFEAIHEFQKNLNEARLGGDASCMSLCVYSVSVIQVGFKKHLLGICHVPASMQAPERKPTMGKKGLPSLNSMFY